MNSYEDKDWRASECNRSDNDDLKEMGREGDSTSSEISIWTSDLYRGKSDGIEECRNSERYGYIYVTENLINHKKYIGQHKAQDFDESYKGSGKALWNAINKYGWENFSCEIIEWCKTREELGEREKYWIDYYDAVRSRNFYNICPGGVWGDTYSGLCDEEKKERSLKLSIACSGENNGFYGKHHTEEAKIKQGKGKSRSDKDRENISKGTKRWYETHESKSKGRKMSPEVVEHNRLVHQGQVSPFRKPVKCLELDKIFSCSGEAADFVINTLKLSKGGRYNCGRCIRTAASNYDGGNRECVSYGYHWSFVMNIV